MRLKMKKICLIFVFIVLAASAAIAAPDLVTVADKTTGESLTAAEFTQLLDALKSGTKSSKTQSLIVNGTQLYIANGLEGTATSDLAEIQVAKIQDKALALVVIPSTAKFYVYSFDAAATTAESVPTVIRPNDYSSAGVWELAADYGETSGTDTIGWSYTALTAAPTGDALIAGKVYRADNDNWDPITYAGTDDYFVLWTGSSWIGVVDINGNLLLAQTSITAAAAPTVDAAGEIAIDTTTDQLAYYGGAKRVIPYKQYASFVIPAPAAADDINLLKAPYGMTILSIACIVQGTTSVTGQLQECSSTGGDCADLDSDITCDADGAADDGTLTDSAIASGGWLRWKTTSVSGTPTFLTVTATYSVVSD
jgi:hypothetical protein